MSDNAPLPANVQAIVDGCHPDGRPLRITEAVRQAYLADFVRRGLIAEIPPAAAASQPPTLLSKAASATKALAKHVADGLRTTTDEERDRRLEICRACDQFDAATVTCRQCGCNLKLKTRLRTGECPQGKWGPDIS